jgi:hypothetical protein
LARRKKDFLQMTDHDGDSDGSSIRTIWNEPDEMVNSWISDPGLFIDESREDILFRRNASNVAA